MRFEHVADRVVLACEQRVHHRQPDPVVVVEASEVEALQRLVRLLRKPTILHRELAVLTCAQLAVSLLGGAVQLRAIPPGGDLVDVRGWQLAARVGGVGARAPNFHDRIAPVVLVGERDLQELRLRVVAVAEPVVVLELKPAGSEQVEARRRFERVAV